MSDKKDKKKKLKHDKKKKEKKLKKRKKSFSSSSKRRKRSKHEYESSNSSGLDSEEEQPNLQLARRVLKSMLDKYPDLLGDLHHLFKLIDKGDSAVLDGIENLALRDALRDFFTSLGLKKKKHRLSFSTRGSNINICLKDEFEDLLRKPKKPNGINSIQEDEKKPTTEKINHQRYTSSIGPSLPEHYETKDELIGSDEEIGPCLPGSKGFRVADEEVVERMKRIAAEEKRRQWNRVKGVTEEADSQSKREDWMTILPQNKTLQASLGQGGDTKHRQFKSGETKDIDPSWCETPEERRKREQEKAEMELLGYSRSFNSKENSSKLESKGASSIHESIMPSANPEEDHKLQEQMKAIKELRGKSLLEKHQEKAKKLPEASSASRTWNRDRDLVGNKVMPKSKAADLIKGSSSMSNRFAAPKMTRQFL